LFLSPPIVPAGDVFKCKDANGAMVFSEHPFGKGSAMSCADANGQVKSGACERRRDTDDLTDAAVIAQPSRPKLNTAVQGISDYVADNHCRESANNLYASDAANNIGTAQRGIDRLASSSWSGGTAAQRQTMRRMDEQQILTLKQTVSQEQARIDDSRKRVAQALAECDKQRVERDRQRDGGAERPL
jgi:hypothetical protein